MKPNIALIAAGIYAGQPHKGVADSALELYSLILNNQNLPLFSSRVNSFIAADYQNLYLQTQKMLEKYGSALIIGGDHSIGAATVAAANQIHKDLKVLWVDAHTDVNTPDTSPTGNIHGMPIAALLGLFDGRNEFGFSPQGLTPDQIVYIGARSIDPGEQGFIEDLGIQVISTQDVQRFGLSQIVKTLQCEWIKNSPSHLSFDLDVIDPSVTSSTGVPVPGGVGFDFVSDLARFISSVPNLQVLELVEFNFDLSKTKLDTMNALKIFNQLSSSFLGRPEFIQQLGRECR